MIGLGSGGFADAGGDAKLRHDGLKSWGLIYSLFCRYLSAKDGGVNAGNQGCEDRMLLEHLRLSYSIAGKRAVLSLEARDSHVISC